jgi:hypothetical protein
LGSRYPQRVGPQRSGLDVSFHYPPSAYSPVEETPTPGIHRAFGLLLRYIHLVHNPASPFLPSSDGRLGAAPFGRSTSKVSILHSSAPAPRGTPHQDDKRDTHAMRAGARARGVLVAIGGDGGQWAWRREGDDCGRCGSGTPDTRTPPVVPVSAPSTSAAVRGGETERGRPGVQVKTVRLCADDNEDLQPPPSPTTTTRGRARMSPRPIACGVVRRAAGPIEFRGGRQRAKWGRQSYACPASPAPENGHEPPPPP